MLLLLTLTALGACSMEQPSTTAPASPAASTTAVQAASPAPSAAAALPSPEPMRDGLINLTHLNLLSEEVQIDGQSQLLTHIYSEAPAYGWVDASGEGIACVDDVARAVIVYLDFYAATKNPRALERARAGLNFVQRLQAPNGEFFNFVLDRDGAINRSGATSYQSLGWWAYRGMWALARGYGAFRESDPAYAKQLETAYLKTEQALAARITNVGATSSVHGFTTPAWLPDGAADSTGVAVLALAEYQAVAPNAATAALLTQLADGLRDYQLGGPGEYPWSMHPHTLNAPGFWHAWGAHEAQALARAGAVLQRDDYIASARREVDTFFAWQLATERVQELGVLPFRQGQQAYGTNSIVQAAMNLFRATGERRYAQMAGLHAAWFTGANMAATPMYDSETGRGYDGIDRELAVNRNAGAESTIEALMALQAVTAAPEAAKYLDYKPVEQRSWRVFEAEAAQEVAGRPAYSNRGWTGEARFSGERFYELRGDDAIELPIEAPATDRYLLYVAHMRRAPQSGSREMQAPQAQRAPTIDARPDEWAALPAVAVDQPQQILRGAESWRGAEIDSFTLRTQWDAHNLYLLAEVRDPQHEQTGVGPGVGAGDTLWLYLDSAGSGSRVTSKLTLAQTPNGPEVWDWTAAFPLPNAELAWAATDGGYVYEAALPWESLRTRGVQIDKQLRIEAGRSFGGNSFMDISGADPDSAMNLTPLRLTATLDAGQSAEQQAAPAFDDPAAIALGLAIDGGEPLILPQAVSPDRDYLWLDRATPQPIELRAGQHTLRLTYAGSDPLRSAIVDGILLQPATAVKTLQGAAGTIRLSFDMLSGVLTIEE
jgi:hypothetical protein